MRTLDFEGERGAKGWRDWKPAKRALESLFHTGELVAVRRGGFQKIYDFDERVEKGRLVEISIDGISRVARVNNRLTPERLYYAEPPLSSTTRIGSNAIYLRGSASSAISHCLCSISGLRLPFVGGLHDAKAERKRRALIARRLSLESPRSESQSLSRPGFTHVMAAALADFAALNYA